MLARTIKPSDEVRVPEVPRGTVVVVTRYREEVAKAVLVHPDDFAMLERSHELLEALDELTLPADPSNAELAALAVVDRAYPERRVQDAERIAAILRL